jgi:hypothetical protein
MGQPLRLGTALARTRQRSSETRSCWRSNLFTLVRLGWDLGDLVPLPSIRTDQTNRDQGAPKAVELGI